MTHKLRFTQDAAITISGPNREPVKLTVKALPSRSPYLAVTQPSQQVGSTLSVTHLPSGLALVSGVSGPRRARYLLAVIAAWPVDYSKDEKQVSATIRAMPEWYAWLKKVQYI